MSDEHLRMSDAEREQAAAELGEHYVQGRLTPEEHSERLDRIWAARTRGELVPIFRDLPGRHDVHQALAGASGAARGGWSRGRVAPRRRGLPVPVIALLVLLVVATVSTHLPWIVIGLLVWWGLSARRHHGWRSRRW